MSRKFYQLALFIHVYALHVDHEACAFMLRAIEHKDLKPTNTLAYQLVFCRGVDTFWTTMSLFFYSYTT